MCFLCVVEQCDVSGMEECCIRVDFFLKLELFYLKWLSGLCVIICYGCGNRLIWVGIQIQFYQICMMLLLLESKFVYIYFEVLWVFVFQLNLRMCFFI